MKRFYLLTLLCCAISFCASSQIGYQVSLLNNATGEARANERVTVKVKITDTEGNIVCEETKSKTSNDFGVISMSVGDSETFANADWSKLPFFIEASVDGRLLGKSQLLSVPVAEYAKKTGSLTKKLLCSKEWLHSNEHLIKFSSDNTCTEISYSEDGNSSRQSYYSIEGNTICVLYSQDFCDFYHYNSDYNIIIGDEGFIYR